MSYQIQVITWIWARWFEGPAPSKPPPFPTVQPDLVSAHAHATLQQMHPACRHGGKHTWPPGCSARAGTMRSDNGG